MMSKRNARQSPTVHEDSPSSVDVYQLLTSQGSNTVVMDSLTVRCTNTHREKNWLWPYTIFPFPSRRQFNKTDNSVFLWCLLWCNVQVIQLRVITATHNTMGNYTYVNENSVCSEINNCNQSKLHAVMSPETLQSNRLCLLSTQQQNMCRDSLCIIISTRFSNSCKPHSIVPTDSPNAVLNVLS